MTLTLSRHSTSFAPRGKTTTSHGQPFLGLLAVQIPHAPFGEIATLPDWDKAYAQDPSLSIAR